MTTRKDVAKLAGVSATSVSYYINNSGYVSDEKRQKIKEAIIELNYRPNLLARSLKVKATNQILLVCNEIRNPFHSELVYFTTKYAYENGYIMLFANVQDDSDYIDKICDYQVCGVIFASNKVTEEQLNRVSDYNIPGITITNMDWENISPNITQIKIDTISAMKNLVDISIKAGHRNLAFLSACPKYEKRLIERKTRGFIDGITENGIPGCESNIIYNITDSLTAYEKAQGLFSQKNYPTAIFCANDAAAVGVLRAAHEAGLKIPKDLIVTGFDNTEHSVTSIPSLTTIDLSVKKVSQLSIDIMMKRINGIKQNSVVIPTNIIRRESM